MYESRILPPAKSDEEVIERIGEAFTIKKVDDPTADQEWAIRLSEEKRVRYATSRFQIYKIVRDEKSALLYDDSLIKTAAIIRSFMIHRISGSLTRKTGR